MSELVHVAVAIILNHNKEVLVSLRAKDSHQGGLWEFPGGKLEQSETVREALKREIYEELNITVLSARSFKKIEFQYPEKTVLLDVWLIQSFTGEAVGAEGQQIKWQAINDLRAEDFPAANRAIINSLQLPDKYMITGPYTDINDFVLKLESSLKSGISLVQLRCKKSSEDEYKKLANKAISLCKSYNAKILLNTTDKLYSSFDADGLHLTSQMLNSIQQRPISGNLLLSVSCHTLDEIKKAKQLNADIILLSPVKETTSHPGVQGIGWEKFKHLSKDIEYPVYALGGMSANDMADAKNNGAQGIAAITGFWGE
ncbi:MAG: Nudix family hydrolase [Gammaproteobacteria bacterium]|nr:Nudix family hydrolase [Gammaproteobacteria bacterium]